MHIRSCLVIGILLGMFLLGDKSYAAEVGVSVNDEQVSFPDAKPFISSSNRTMVPVRFISEHLGYELTWNEKAQTIKFTKNNKNLYLRVGLHDSVIIQSRTYVPLRFVAESLDAEVLWDQKGRIAKVYLDEIVEPTAPVDEPEITDQPDEVLVPASSNPQGWKQKATEIIETAELFYGVDYLYGAKAGRTDVFDCSSFTQYVYWKNGIKLKRASRPQFLYDGNQVLTREELRMGDLVFFSTGATAKKYDKEDYRRNGHVGIVKEVKKNGEIIFIHTYKPGVGVTDSKMHADLKKGWWNRHFLYGKRVIADDGSEALDVEVIKTEIRKMVQ